MAICQEFGFEGLFPVDNDFDAEADAAAIFRANCAQMKRADIGVFNLSPFRGPSADAGTVFELRAFCFHGIGRSTQLHQRARDLHHTRGGGGGGSKARRTTGRSRWPSCGEFRF